MPFCPVVMNGGSLYAKAGEVPPPPRWLPCSSFLSLAVDRSCRIPDSRVDPDLTASLATPVVTAGPPAQMLLGTSTSRRRPPTAGRRRQLGGPSGGGGETIGVQVKPAPSSWKESLPVAVRSLANCGPIFPGLGFKSRARPRVDNGGTLTGWKNLTGGSRMVGGG